MRTVTTPGAARAEVAAATARGDRVALVPTAGGLHAGHLALVARAREVADLVVVSVVTGRLPPAAGEATRPPRDPEADAAALAAGGADLVLIAQADDDGWTQDRASAGPLGRTLEGRGRAGYLDAVLTDLLRVLRAVGPDVVVVGQRDAQRVLLLRRMVRDLGLGVEVDVVETVRDADGLALSSGTAALAPHERRLARVVPRALDAAESYSDRDVDAMVAAAQGALAGEDGADVEYLAVVDPASFRPVDDGYRGLALVLVAARVGGARLIDNRFVHLG